MKSRILVNSFIIIYFSYAIIWLWLKAPAPLRPADDVCTALGNKLEPFALWTGFEQYWALFSPNVKTENAYTLTVITFKNGMLKLYELPRMEKMDLLTKMHHEKYRKLFNDNMPMALYMPIRPAVAKFIARANNKPGNPPLRVAYFQISNPISPPQQIPFWQQRNPPEFSKSHIGKYFVYGVSPNDL